jgi:deoxyribodipyrimidine photo-lyase
MIIDPKALTEQFVAQKFAPYYRGDVVPSSSFVPTLEAAEQRLTDYQPKGYADTRNHVHGNVSRLNPYITWGVFTLREVQAAIKPKVPDKDYSKFVSELAWKAYFRAAHTVLGKGVYQSLEPYKYPTRPKADALTAAVQQAKTGVECIDNILKELFETGYLHNHKRMWFAAWLVHYAGFGWQGGERLFYHYLLDGESGPNALSWQWVASTFSSKPYYFNAANMRKYGHNGCRGSDFDDSYEALNDRFFAGYGDGSYAKRPDEQPQTALELPMALSQPLSAKPLVVLHAERLSLRARVLATCSGEPVAVVLDSERFKREAPSFARLYWALKLAGDVVTQLQEQGRSAQLLWLSNSSDLVQYANEHGRDGIAAADSWHPETQQSLLECAASLSVTTVRDEPFAEVKASLRSFSSYWRKAEKQVLRR